jgi:hypothetical protein
MQRVRRSVAVYSGRVWRAANVFSLVKVKVLRLLKISILRFKFSNIYDIPVHYELKAACVQLETTLQILRLIWVIQTCGFTVSKMHVLIRQTPHAVSDITNLHTCE